MLESGDSDGDFSLQSTNSGSSMSSSCDSSSSYSRLSFDVTATRSSPDNNFTLKPHRSSDFAYSTIRSRTGLTFRDFHLLRRIGAGDIGTVYLCRLNRDSECRYAMKVVDKEALALKKKEQRAEMEKKILKMLDHPFLPTLYAEFEASHFSCIVMEYCSGGDLHSLRHKQPLKRFSLTSARFYAAEVLVALEYLHMLGIIYRDLKPENVLVRSDGHIMLSDFDLSLCSHAIPAVESHSSYHPASPPSSSTGGLAAPRQPFSCLPSWTFPSRKIQTLNPKRLFVAEPVTARSCSFVGTHEYVAPEVASGGSHGNAVDWWALGIFIYELIYGRTPFSAPSNSQTLRNIVKRPLAFPTKTPVSTMEEHARDLISGLLDKDPTRRLGSKRGSADVKTHAFFKGLNFALIRTVTPPTVPCLRRQRTTPLTQQRVGKNREAAHFDYF
ncbi:Protein kinase PINOID [Linum perenne]